MESSQVFNPSYKNSGITSALQRKAKQEIFRWRVETEGEKALLISVQDERAAQVVRMLAYQGRRRSFSIQRIRLQMATWTIRLLTLKNIKRVFDFTVCLLILPILLPVIALTALAIRIDSPGPILFRQPRVGKWGKVFHCYKFRSMYTDAEQRKAELLAHNEADEIIFKMKSDPRVTRVGRIIRKLSIDELPQFFNVIEGNMSLVGPRPPVPYEVSHYAFDHLHRLEVTPGITGLQQVSGRSDLPFKRWIELDLSYIQQQSMRKDIEILLRTVPAVLTGRGAY